MVASRDYPSLDDVKRRVIAAICKLYRCDRELLEVDANERSITHKLAEYLQVEFPCWHVDCEYNRLGNNVKRLHLGFRQVDPEATEATTVFPDIIIHKRKTNQNLLVIEVKKATGQTETRDIEKLKAFIQTPEYRYRYGLFLKLGANDDPELRLYRDGEEQSDWTGELQRALGE